MRSFHGILCILVLVSKLIVSSTTAGINGSLSLVASTIVDQPLPSSTCSVAVYNNTPHVHVARVNSTVQLNCTLDQTGYEYPAVNVQWLRDGAKLVVKGLEDGQSKLVLERVQLNDSGVYGCRFLNNKTTPMATVELQVGMLPAKATNLRCSCSDFFRVFCYWVDGPNTNLETTHSLLWLDDYESGLCVTQQRLADRNATSICTFSTRHSSKFFNFFVKSSNALGCTYSVMYDFTPYRDTVTLPPHLVRVIPLSKESLSIFIEPPVGFENFPVQLEEHSAYKLKWKCMWKKNGTERVFPYHEISNHTNPIFNLTELTYCRYQISAQVRYSKTGWSNSSNVIEARTKERDPHADLDVKCPFNVSDSIKAVNVSWTPPPESKMQGIVTQYVVTVEDVLDSTVLMNATLLPNVTSFNVNDLNPDIHYKIRVVAFNSVGGTDREANTCPVLPTGSADKRLIAVGLVLAVLLLTVILLVLFLKILKKSRFSGIRLNNRFHNNDISFSDTSRRPHREKEQFDELINGVEVAVLNGDSDSNAVCGGDEMTNGFVLERDQSLQSILDCKHPLLYARRISGLANENYTKEPTEELIGGIDYLRHCDGWQGSALSVGSGGSYLALRGGDDTSQPSSWQNSTTSPIAQDGTGEQGPDFEKLTPQDFPYMQMGVKGEISAPENLRHTPASQPLDEKLFNPLKTTTEPGQYVTQGFFPWPTHNSTKHPDDLSGAFQNANGDESSLLLSRTPTAKLENDLIGANFETPQISELANMPTADSSNDTSGSPRDSPEEAAEQNSPTHPEDTDCDNSPQTATASGYVSVLNKPIMDCHDLEIIASNNNAVKNRAGKNSIIT